MCSSDLVLSLLYFLLELELSSGEVLGLLLQLPLHLGCPDKTVVLHCLYLTLCLLGREEESRLQLSV